MTVTPFVHITKRKDIVEVIGAIVALVEMDLPILRSILPAKALRIITLPRINGKHLLLNLLVVGNVEGSLS